MFNIELSDFWVRSKNDDTDQAEVAAAPAENNNANQPQAVTVPAANNNGNQGGVVAAQEANNNANQAGAVGGEVRRKSWRERLHMGNGQTATQAGGGTALV